MPAAPDWGIGWTFQRKGQDVSPLPRAADNFPAPLGDSWQPRWNGIMDIDEYRRMFQLETTYWWFVGRRALVRDWVAAALRRQPAATSERWLLDAGCGTGANAEMLRAFGRVIGTDVSPEALHWSRQRGLSHLARCRVEKLCFADDTFDVVTALDMLEHVDDDLAALAELHRVCKPGGAVIITVPAYGFLWSPHDEALHHRRRYAPRELRDKLQAMGFEVERLSHFMCGLFLPVLLLRFWQSLRKQGVRPQSDLRPLPTWLNGLLIRLLGIERWLISLFSLPLGVSLICTARKRAWVRSLVQRRPEFAYDFGQCALDDAYINRFANEPHAPGLEFSRRDPVRPTGHERDG